jgi:predicted nuclease of predicted toxin-antitoxin system
VKFLIDAQLPRRLASLLIAAGHDVIHTLDLPNANRTTDAEINAIAAAEQRIVVTKDQDFVDSLLLANEPERLLWVTTGNIRNDALIALFTANLATIEAAFAQGRYVELSTGSVLVHL